MRCAGMPLEKIALYMNSSQVSGKGQLAQSIRLTFKDGLLTPYRVVGPASLVAWFFQYSVMGFAFQFFDSTLSSLMGAQPVYYGPELMKPAPKKSEAQPSSVVAANVVKTALAPLLSGSLESLVANRAEVERYYGRQQFKQIESNLNWGGLAKFCGPGYFANASRNVVMCSTTFVLTPITYKLYFPQEKKSKTTLFWYGLGMNIFAGNVIAITQQALWGRALDYGAVGGGRPINYEAVVREGLKKEGISAFFTPAKWFSRVLMNAPAQGALPWYYNEILPMGEHKVLQLVKKLYGIR
mmetsp:Transcript_17642/g.37453  ORF Transcript_17642/g.37453 Transcript_17642/m.37453 type:complete len:297 (-) Transcript_17642:524-1414(-)